MKGRGLTKPITAIRDVPVAQPSQDDPPAPSSGCTTTTMARPSEVLLQIVPLKVIGNNGTGPPMTSISQEGMLSYFHRFSVFLWKGENDSNTLRVDAYVLEDGKKLRFQKYPGSVIEGFTRIYITG